MGGEGGAEDGRQGRTRVKGLVSPAQESASLPDLEKRKQTQSSYVGGQVDETWQLMGCEEVGTRKKQRIKNNPHGFQLGQLSKQ